MCVPGLGLVADLGPLTIQKCPFEIHFKLKSFIVTESFSNLAQIMIICLPCPVQNSLRAILIITKVMDQWDFMKYQFNSLEPSDAIWHQRSGSTLAQVMAYCLTASSHYLNQCWLIISKVQWHPPESNFTKDTSVTEISCKITYLNFCSNLPGVNELRWTWEGLSVLF